MQKIGVFDSGVGGMTVLAVLREALPGSHFLYLGDTAHVPYGTKSREQVRVLSRQAAETFRIKNIDLLVVACNTASSIALDVFTEVLAPVPVLGVVAAGAHVARQKHALMRPEAPILVLATRATIASHAYMKALVGLVCLEQACPLLVPLIEEGWIDHPVLDQVLLEYIKPYLHLEPGIVLLGCTHYPWITASILRALPGWHIVHSAQAVAEQVCSIFPNMQGSGHMEWIFTDEAALPAFARALIESA